MTDASDPPSGQRIGDAIPGMDRAKLADMVGRGLAIIAGFSECLGTPSTTKNFWTSLGNACSYLADAVGAVSWALVGLAEGGAPGLTTIGAGGWESTPEAASIIGEEFMENLQSSEASRERLAHVGVTSEPEAEGLGEAMGGATRSFARAPIRVSPDETAVLTLVGGTDGSSPDWFVPEVLDTLIALIEPLSQRVYRAAKAQERLSTERVELLETLRTHINSITGASREAIIRATLSWVREQLNAEVAAILTVRRWRLVDFLKMALPAQYVEQVVAQVGPEEDTYIEVLESCGHEIVGVGPGDDGTFREVFLTSEADVQTCTQMIGDALDLSPDEVRNHEAIGATAACNLGWTPQFFLGERAWVLENDFGNHPAIVNSHREEFTAQMPSGKLAACVAVKLAVGGEEFGAVRVTNKVERFEDPEIELADEGFSKDDVQLLELLANETALAVQHAESVRMYEDCRGMTEELVRASALSASGADLAEAMHDVAVYAASLVTDAKSAHVIRRDPETSSYSVVATTREHLVGTEIAESLVREVEREFADDAPLRVFQKSRGGSPQLTVDPASLSGVQALFRYQDELVGILSVESTQENAFELDAHTESALQVIVKQAAVAIASENARAVIARVEDRFRQIHTSLLGSLMAYSVGHQLGEYIRVAHSRLRKGWNAPGQSAYDDACDALQSAEQHTAALLDLSKGLESHERWTYVSDILDDIERLAGPHVDWAEKEYRPRRPLNLEMKMASSLKRPSGFSESDLRDTLDRGTRPQGNPVRVDPYKVLQIAMNLITNAVKASKEVGGDVTVAAYLGKERDEWTLTVSDHGCGFDAETKRKMFEPFYTETGGFGFGLFVCERLAREMGAHIEAESSGPGSGAIFRVHFPWRASE